MSWLKWIFLFLGFVLLFRLFIADLYFVPTDSMEGSIIAGSYILVEKGGYGAKLPRSLREIPWVARLARWTGYNVPLWSNQRMAGWRDVNRLDAVLTEMNGIKIIKRIVAMPGDQVEVKNGRCFINNKPAAEPADLKFTQTIYSDDTELLQQLRTATEEPWTYLGDRTFKVVADSSYFAQLRQYPALRVRCIDQTAIDASEDRGIYPKARRGEWDRNNYGVLTVPYEGLEIALDTESWATYCWTLELHEGVEVNCEQREAPFVINGQEESRYRFTKDYYFLLGDNRMESFDSRFFGCFPEDILFGRVSHVFN
ncbi:MAG: signal peptidase I [Bacteroidota bacterium]